MAEDARRLLLELDATVPGASGSTGECRPALDVIDTAEAVEVVVDVPGVPAAALRVAVRRDTVLVVGAKLTPSVDPDARFHRAERGFGRFARAVRVAGSFDAGAARASVVNGQLRVVLPRVADRRGRVFDVPVSSA